MQCRRPWLSSWVGKIHWRRDRLPTPLFLAVPCGSAGKESARNVGDLGWVPGLGPSVGKIPWRRERLTNPVFWPGECPYRVHGVTKSWTRLSEFHHHSSSGTLCLLGGQKLQKNHPAVFTTCFQYLQVMDMFL